MGLQSLSTWQNIWREADLWRGQRLAILALGALIALRITDPWALEAARLKVFDAFMTLAASDTASPEVVIVDIDEASLAAHGQWPWPRTRLAALTNRITAQNPAALGFDILFSEPDQHSPDAFLRSQPGLPADLRSELSGLPSNDMIFAQSLARQPAVLAVVADPTPAPPQAKPPPLANSAPVMEIGGDPRLFLPKFESLLRPVAPLEAAGNVQAVINLSFERDGILRRVPAVVSVGRRILPAMSLELVRLAGQRPAVGILVRGDGIDGIALGRNRRPTDRQARIWINFSRDGRYETVSAGELLAGAVAPDRFSGKIVLVGSTAAGIASYVATPLGRAMPSLLIHAEFVSTLLLDKPVTRLPIALVVELLLILVIGTGLILAQSRCRPRKTMLFGMVLLPAIVVGAWLVLEQERWLMDPSFPALTLILMLPATISARLVQEDRARREAERLGEVREREREARIRSLQAELLRTSRESAMGHLSSALSHELNQPLAAIHNFVQAAQILAGKGKEAASEKLVSLLEKALEQARRGSSILRGMRDVVERGEISAKSSDINAIVREAADLCGETYKIRVYALDLDLAPDLPPVLVNPVQIHQVLINLIQNAFDAGTGTGSGEADNGGGTGSGVSVTIETKAMDAGLVEVAVCDRGPGLSDEILANPFKPFATTKADGMGLGLSICQAIVETHGGRLSVEAREGGGTVFRFTLPVVAAEA